MKVLLLKDVHKLGRAGDVKKVANGYGRNYLIPQGLAVLATPGALKQVERIRAAADVRRAELNQELGGVAAALNGQVLLFPVRASETGRMYGSITSRLIAEEIQQKFSVEISHRQIETEPIRNLGRYTVPIRLTLDLAPEVTVIVHREGETPDLTEEDELEDAQAPLAAQEQEMPEAEDAGPPAGPDEPQAESGTALDEAPETAE